MNAWRDGPSCGWGSSDAVSRSDDWSDQRHYTTYISGPMDHLVEADLQVLKVGQILGIFKHITSR